jgi:hypothetical protein
MRRALPGLPWGGLPVARKAIFRAIAMNPECEAAGVFRGTLLAMTDYMVWYVRESSPRIWTCK